MNEELKFILYRVTCAATGKSYIGLTRSALAHRWAQHVNTSSRGDRGCPAFHAAIVKHGPDAFAVEELLRVGSLEEANEAEAQLIAQHGTLVPGGYNLDAGGNATERTPETRAKISASLKARPFTPQAPRKEAHKKAISVAKRGKQPRGTGWSHSPETKARIALGRRSWL